MGTRKPARQSRAWVVIEASSVPPEWADRSRVVSLVALLPEEARSLLGDHEVRPAATPEDAEFLRLVAEGRAGSYIARRLGMSERSVFRHLARWRDHFEVESTAELAAELSKRGF